jgi:signal transduction histidine kinase
MRAMYKTRNFASLLGLIEEAQSMGNRMEAALEDQRDIKNMDRRRKKLKTQLVQATEALEKAIDLAEAQEDEDLVTALKQLTDTSYYRGW